MRTDKPRPDRRKVRPAVVAGTVLAVVAVVGAAPAAAYVRNETALGMRAFGDPDLRWAGGTFPAAPATTVPRYRVVSAPVIRLSATARRHLLLDRSRSYIDENGKPYTYPLRHLETHAQWGATAVWASRATDRGRPVGSQEAIRTVRALFEKDLGLRPADWHFEVRPPRPGEYRSAALTQTIVSVDPVVEGRPLIQYGGYRIGGSVTVDSKGIGYIDLLLARLVRDGSTPTESAAPAWHRAKHHKAGADEEVYLGDAEAAFTEATPGIGFSLGRDGQLTVSDPTWTFSNHDGGSITVATDSAHDGS